MARKGLIQKTFTFDGKRYYVSGKTEIEAIENRALLRQKLESGRIILNRDTLVRNWIAEWISTYKDGAVNDRWLTDIQSLCNNYINPIIGCMRIGAVKPLHIKKVLAQVAEMSTSMNSKLYDVLNQIFKTAMDNRLIEYSPMQGIRKPKGSGTKTRRPITDYEREITLRVAEYNRGGLFVLLALYCGLRPQEIVPLQWCDVDFERKRVRIYKALKSDGLVKPYTKTEAGQREVPIPAVLLARLRKEQGEPFALLCPNTLGLKLSKTSFRDLWLCFKRDMQIEAGCKVFRNQLVPPFPIADDLTLYCYRHTYCTDLQAAGVPINVAKELMGHADISVTSKIYTHHSEVSTDNAANLIDAYIASNG